jgi:hypothetical protein
MLRVAPKQPTVAPAVPAAHGSVAREALSGIQVTMEVVMF